MEHFNVYASGWAWAGSTPFQWVKDVASHFGGTRNPLIVSWPARIKDPGGVRSQFTHANDVAATLYDAAGIQFPEVVDGVKQVATAPTSIHC
jgi:arylsulfatase